MKGDEGILGLCKGAKATLVIPPEMGYGARGAGRDIPGGATVSWNNILLIDVHGKDPIAVAKQSWTQEICPR